MANNRMYLWHKPSGYAVYLGKRMLDGWYDVPSNLPNRLQALYSLVQDHKNNNDDFTIAMEDACYSSTATDAWEDVPTFLIDRGLRVFKEAESLSYKLCKDCAHLSRQPALYRCDHPFYTINLVTGKKQKASFMCHELRADENLCGPKAKAFRPKAKPHISSNTIETDIL